MTDNAKYGRRNVSKMLAQWNAHRAVCRAEGTPGVQSTLEHCEEWIDFAFQPPADRITALEDALRQINSITEASFPGATSGVDVAEIQRVARATLAASQPAQPVAVTVKPLVWEELDDECYSWKAPLFGSVLVKRHWKGLWVVVWSTPGYTELFAHGQFPTPHEAKAAAEARILAALDVQPLTVQDAARVPVIAALIEARRHHVETVKAYNAKLKYVKIQRLNDDWSQDVATEFAEMSEAHRDFIAVALTAADAALRAIAEGRA